jgi:hypothetical protein
VIELPASRRSIDVVIRLRCGRETYLRHVEFEMRYRRGLELRLFEYAARLGAQFRLPVFTTVVFMGPPAPRRLSYREGIRGQVVHERHFDVLRLWDLDPDELLAMGPGPAALVGRARDSARAHVQAAVQLIMRTALPERADLLYVLQALSAERYTARELEGMIPKEAAMASGMFAKEFRQARAEGLRLSCLDIVKYRHPDVLGRVTPAVQACASITTLRKWTLAAARLPAADFVRLVTAAPSRKRGMSQRRAPRPARRASARRA